MKTKLFSTQQAAIRHALSKIGADWEKSHSVYPVELPNSETLYAVMPKFDHAKNQSSRGQLPARKNAQVEPSFVPKSKIEGATRKVWDIADLMKGKPRREILEECRRQGIATGTAATQYQRWKTANHI